jgi:hypothetical protein
MLSILHTEKGPNRLQADGAFLRSEAWQSGLLHRAYPSADLWASIPLAGSREFEPHRFHHRLFSGADAAETAPAPDHQPRDLAPRKMTAPRNIAPITSDFQNAAQSPQLTDLARHEHPLPRKAD